MEDRDVAPRRFSLAGRATSVAHALNGLKAMLAAEHNARVHLALALAAVLVGLVLGLAPLEWAAIVVAIVLVFLAEAFNTAIERLADAAVPGRHPLVGLAKDMAAGGVLVAAAGAAAIGCLVFGPKLLALVG